MNIFVLASGFQITVSCLRIAESCFQVPDSGFQIVAFGIRILSAAQFPFGNRGSGGAAVVEEGGDGPSRGTRDGARVAYNISIL